MLVSYLAAQEAAKRLGIETPEDFTRELANKLRSPSGLRLQNCKMNTGKARFAFNVIQRRFLPAELRPPKSCAGAGVQN